MRISPPNAQTVVDGLIVKPIEKWANKSLGEAFQRQSDMLDALSDAENADEASQPDDELGTGVALAELNGRIRELEQKLENRRDMYDGIRRELKVMQEDRDEYRARLLKAKEPAFFLVWNPLGIAPPRYQHMSHAGAKDEAVRLAALHTGQEFYVLAEAGHAISESVNWYCDQRQYDEEMPF